MFRRTHREGQAISLVAAEQRTDTDPSPVRPPAWPNGSSGWPAPAPSHAVLADADEDDYPSQPPEQEWP